MHFEIISGIDVLIKNFKCFRLINYILIKLFRGEVKWLRFTSLPPCKSPNWASHRQKLRAVSCLVCWHNSFFRFSYEYRFSPICFGVTVGKQTSRNIDFEWTSFFPLQTRTRRLHFQFFSRTHFCLHIRVVCVCVCEFLFWRWASSGWCLISFQWS